MLGLAVKDPLLLVERATAGTTASGALEQQLARDKGRVHVRHQRKCSSYLPLAVSSALSQSSGQSSTKLLCQGTSTILRSGSQQKCMPNKGCKNLSPSLTTSYTELVTK